MWDRLERALETISGEPETSGHNNKFEVYMPDVASV